MKKIEMVNENLEIRRKEREIVNKGFEKIGGKESREWKDEEIGGREREKKETEKW